MRTIKNNFTRILNLTGIVLMVAVITATIPLTIPKLFGIHIYQVLSGSMVPVYPIGSVIYVKECSPQEVKIGDVITFLIEKDSDNVVTHRVVGIDMDQGKFITKGYANPGKDPEGVLFTNVVGKTVFCIPIGGIIYEKFNTILGKIFLVSIFILTFIIWLLADKLKKSGTNNINIEETQKNVKKSHKKMNLIYIIRAVAIIVVLISSVSLILIAMDYRSADKEYKSLLEDDIAVMNEEPITEKDNEIIESGKFVPDKDIVDSLSNLKEKNGDMVGWIDFDQADISYPIVRGDDNKYYLTHTFLKSENKAGAIFMETENHEDLLDFHTIVYGHNLKNGSMFGKLKRYNDKEFYDKHSCFTIYQEDAAFRYQIFSIHNIPYTDKIYTVWYDNQNDFEDFIKRLNKQSFYDTGVTATRDDRIMTLSTCTASEEKRLVIHAKLSEIVFYE